MAVVAMAQSTDISGERIRAHVKFLASDLLEGRGVGARGGDLATEYIATQFALAGAKPAGDNGTYFQNLTLVGVEPQPTSTLTAGDDCPSTGWTISSASPISRRPMPRFDADAVFVGHGIVAPGIPVGRLPGRRRAGKVVVLFTNEPPSNDPKFFTGRALTYYGRWTYKYEEATRHGAVAAIIIHTTPTASYGWDVVRSSWGSEDQQVKLAPGEQPLAFAGVGDEGSGRENCGVAFGKTVDELLKMADTRGFQADAAAAAHSAASAPAKVREIQTRNVVAKIEGSDPQTQRRSRDFQRALGSSGHRRGGERRRDLQRRGG